MTELLPNAKELRALRLFVSKDKTRFDLSKLWRHESDGGATYVASDGHTIVVRRSGTHRTMPTHEIRKLAALEIDDKGAASIVSGGPPAWDQVLKAGTSGKPAVAYSIDPDYFARIGDVERAAGGRAADDFVLTARMSQREAAQKRAQFKAAFATLYIPSEPFDGWFWRLDRPAALWEGVIMPRRV